MHNILLALDSKLYTPSLTLINSIVKNNENNVSFFILVSEKKDEYKKLLEKHFKNTQFTIEKFKIEDEYKEIIEIFKEQSKKNNHIFHPMNFARFYLPVIFKQIDKGIMLDIDMIVQTNFDNLLKEFDYLKKDFHLCSPLIMDCSEMSLDKIGYTGKAFNNGFLVWNLKKYRDENYINKVKELMLFHKENNIWKLGTQPIFNIIYYKKVIDLNRFWNHKGFGKIAETNDEKNNVSGKSAFVIHWNANIKPWDSDKVIGYKYWKKYFIYDSI